MSFKCIGDHNKQHAFIGNKSQSFVEESIKQHLLDYQSSLEDEDFEIAEVRLLKKKK